MSSLAQRQANSLQADFFQEPYNSSDVWQMRLSDAFADTDMRGGLLPLAKEAIKACPGEPIVLLLAATAALLDSDPECALVYLKRFSKRAEARASHLLKALALHGTNKTAAAKTLLKRHRMATWRDAFEHFPGGHERLPWLIREHSAIMEHAPPRHKAPAVAHAKPKLKSRPQKKPVAANKKKPAAAKTTKGAPPKKGGAPSTVAPAPTAETALVPQPLRHIDIDIPISMEIDLKGLSATLALEPERDGRWFDLRGRLAHLGLEQGFDELISLNHCTGFVPLWHQTETVRKVLKRFRGRVLLADEVGLGKTIEACMVLKEYMLRGMAERVLILTPASLVGQWREELDVKFGLDFATTYDPLLRQDPDTFWNQDRIVASIASARRREHAELLQAQQFDLVICDEAHHLRDRKSQSWKLVDGLNKRFLLLLSATPVQNDLIELYNLLTLLKPGIFKTPKEFRAGYMTPGKPRQPANPERLRVLMRDAMIRNTRAVVALKLPRRHAVTVKADPASGEAEAYADLANLARAMAKEGGAGKQRLALHHLLAAAGSSPAAAAGAVERAAARKGANSAWKKLAKQWAAIGAGGKEEALIDLLAKNPAEKKLVFVHSRETLEHLGDRLAEAGFAFVKFDGSMSGPKKDAAVDSFRDHAQVMLCTQSGGEGRNIQFCNTLINFDLPLNPMVIEQRIGRIDRIGQTREIFVFNLVTRGTLEEQVLALLDEKIAMFELVVGEVGAILGGLAEEREFPDLVLEAWLESTDAGRLDAFDRLGRGLDDARRQHDSAKALDEKLFGDDFEAG